MGTYINPANAITASRYLTLPAFLHYFQQGEVQLATAMIILCGVLDLFDGPAARAFNCSTGFGEMFDAVTDALCYAFFIAVETFYGKLPLIPILLIVLLSIVNAGLRLAYAKRVGRTTNYRSFAMERVVAYAAYLTGVAVVEREAFFYAWALPFIMLVVLAHDFKRMILDPVPAE